MEKSSSTKSANLFSGDNLKLIIASIVVFITRIPFLSAGYGVDNDAWRFAHVCKIIALEGRYQYSRAPGHPIQEYALTSFWDWGYSFFNGASAVMSVIAFIYFILILKELKFKNIYLAGFAFALTPIIYVSSVNSLDNIWNLAFIMPAIYYGMKNKWLWAGILLGLANGNRLTSLVFMLPIVIIMFYKNKDVLDLKDNIKKLVYFVVVTGAITTICYLPGLITFGQKLFTDVAWAYPGVVFILFRYLISIWGLIGIAAICITCLIEVIRRLRGNKSTYDFGEYGKHFTYAMLSMVIIYTIIFLGMPHKPSYLVPIVPLVIILLSRFLSPKLFRIVCIALVISPFMFGMNRTGLEIAPEVSAQAISFDVAGGKIFVDPLNGPIFNDHSKRKKMLEQIDKVFTEANKLTRKSVIVTGEVYPLLINTFPTVIKNGKLWDHFSENVRCEYSLNKEQLQFYVDNGYDIYFLPGEDLVTKLLYGYELSQYGRKLYE